MGDEIRVKTEAGSRVHFGEARLAALREAFLERINELRGRSHSKQNKKIVQKLTDSSLEMIDLARRR